MSVFTVAGKTCALFDEQSSQAVEFTDGYNSSYCGSLAESDSMMDKMRNLYKMKPYIPPVVQCSWAGEDCGQTQCCNNIDCNWDYTKCTGYKCFKKDALFAGCKPGSAPAVWDGLELGGQRQPREVAKAKEGILTQGTSLFCISVVMWHAGASKPFYDTEADIANNWMQKGMGIMQCEDHMVIDGVTAPLSTWGSYSNIDAFIQIWDGVRKDGRYLQHDWVVKVDPDAVFFPDRLRSHISKLGPPQGSRVYLLNNEYRFQFMGALEVMTREAATLYFENAHVCNKGAGGHTGGEDYYMKTCLNGIGVDFQKDYALLHDKYAAQDDGCANGWSAAFHFFKKVSSWEECHQQALDAR